MTDVRDLIRAAMESRKFSYAPYSGFQVGAALLAKDGRIFTGCNIENAAYSPTNCAERTAFFKAISEGVREFNAICIVGGKKDGPLDYTAPCGVCRQVMMEFCAPQAFDIIMAIDENHFKVEKLGLLFPMGFGPGNLK